MAGDPELIYFDGLSAMRWSAAAAEPIVTALPGERRYRNVPRQTTRFQLAGGSRRTRV